MKYNYKLNKKIELSIEDFEFFLSTFRIDNFSEYSDWDMVNEDFNFNFYDNSVKRFFHNILKLNHIWAIHLNIPYLDRDFPVHESNITWDIPQYLYEHSNDYLSKIRIWTQIRMWIALKTENFLLWYLQILYQEKDIALLENYKILDDLVSSIKSKLWKEYIQNEISLFYDSTSYDENLYSIFPMLVELRNNWFINIREIKYDKWEIWFNIRILSDLDKINKEAIISVFWSSDINTIWVEKDYIVIFDDLYYNYKDYYFYNPKVKQSYPIKWHWDYDVMMDILYNQSWKNLPYESFYWMKTTSLKDSRSKDKIIRDKVKDLQNNIQKNLNTEANEFISIINKNLVFSFKVDNPSFPSF